METAQRCRMILRQRPSKCRRAILHISDRHPGVRRQALDKTLDIAELGSKAGARAAIEQHHQLQAVAISRERHQVGHAQLSSTHLELRILRRKIRNRTAVMFGQHRHNYLPLSLVFSLRKSQWSRKKQRPKYCSNRQSWLFHVNHPFLLRGSPESSATLKTSSATLSIRRVQGIFDATIAQRQELSARKKFGAL